MERRRWRSMVLSAHNCGPVRPYVLRTSCEYVCNAFTIRRSPCTIAIVSRCLSGLVGDARRLARRGGFTGLPAGVNGEYMDIYVDINIVLRKGKAGTGEPEGRGSRGGDLRPGAPEWHPRPQPSVR